MTTYQDYGITNVPQNTRGQLHTTCPECSHLRKKSSEKCLSINADEGTWFCHHCGWTGSLKKSERKKIELPNFDDVKQKETSAYTDDLYATMHSYFESRGITQNTCTANGLYPATDYHHNIWFAFPYYEESKVVNIKYRGLQKEFKQTAGGHRTFYRIQTVENARKVIVTEGEIDALSFVEAGFESAISVPDGAINPDAKNVNAKMQFFDNTVHYFDSVELIYLALDNDGAGRRMTEELARRFGKERCKIVQFPDGCKDANETLLAHGKEMLNECITNAIDYPLEGVHILSNSATQVLDIYENGFPQGVVTNAWPKFDRLIRWFPGHFTVVTGIPSHGKSNFVDNLIVNLARHNGWRVAVFSPENPTPEMWVIRLLEIATGESFFGQDRIKPDKINETINALSQYFFMINPDDDYSIEKVTATAKSLLRRFGINALVIDPWNNLEVKNKSGENETAYAARILVKLRSFARQTGIHIILIAHPRKMQKTDGGNYDIPTAYDISGSAHFYNVADNIMSVYREFHNSDDDISTTHVHVQKVKTKYSGQIGSSRFDFDKKTQRYMEIQ